MTEFSGKVALVTGGASGIGAAIAAQVHAAGSAVVLVDVNGDAVRRAAADLGDRAVGVPADVTDEAAIAAAVDTAVTTFGRLDAAFNVAGLARIGTILDGDVDEWKFTVDVVLGGTYIVTRQAGRAMRDAGTGGAIVNVSSLNAHTPLYGGSSYAAAKAGVESFTKNSALELGQFGIRVNAVLPGLVDTPMTAPFLGVESVANDFLARIIAGRAGTPAEIAQACVFLASEGASYINGTSLVVDGGWEVTNYPDLSPFT